MNGALLLLAGSLIFIIAYRVIGRAVERALGVDFTRLTPAHTMQDGIDYVPTRPAILFGHHFASIAGAGPIVGPVLAAQFGWLAVALWVVFGCVLIGAVHDMAAMFLSVRHQGRSIGTIIEELMGRSGRILFLSFCWFTLILVVAEFLRIVAATFVDKPEVATPSLIFILMALVFGTLIYHRVIGVLTGSLIFVPLTFVAIYVGIILPLDLTKILGCDAAAAANIWIMVLLVYCFTASVLPVWLLLQPRDYLNSYLLYAMLLLGAAGVFFAAPAIKLDVFAGWSVANPVSGIKEPLLPMLFVTVACGACSGFHALVASGTTAKQIDKEAHLRPIGYGSMLIEGVLALIALVAVGSLTQGEYLAAIRERGAVSLFANGIAGFTGRLGLPHEAGVVFISLTLAAFLMTTLDTATRLARFTWQEIFTVSNSVGTAESAATSKEKTLCLFTNRYVATAVSVVAAGWLLLGGGVQSLWSVFASSNQLLAALTLLGILLWMLRHKRPVFLIVVPLLFMIVTSGSAVITLFTRSVTLWRSGGFQAGGVMSITAGVLLCMAVALIVLGLQHLHNFFYDNQKHQGA